MAGQGIGGRYVITLRSTTGRSLALEFRFRLDTIEMWYQDHCQAVLDRDWFRYWLEYNARPYVVDDVMWSVIDTGQIALVIRNSGWWLFPAHLVDELHERV